MKKNFNSFSQYINGKWLLQENFYSLYSKTIENYHKKIQFLNKQENRNNNSLSKIKKIKSDILIICTEKKNKKIFYKEYFYYISNNIIISFGILKHIKKQQYLGLKISSYIRIL